MDKAELRDVFNQIGRSAAPATIVDDTGREIQYGVEAAHLPAAFHLRR
ncbi:MAG: hypothetical protein ACJ8H8_27535 [Geminicoccaceae bacterium]